MRRLAVYPLCALCAWGVLAIGAVYPWGYRPLATGAAVLGVALVADPRVRAQTLRQPLAKPFAWMLMAVAFQLLPFPIHVIESFSPARADVLSQYSLAYSAGLSAHPLSIDPSATKLALVLGTTWAFLLLVVSSWLSTVGARRLAIGIVLLGVVVALAGLAQQRPCHACRIYGVWQPEGKGISFAPFVNRNHFAGWMAMALPLTMGVLAGSLARTLPHGIRTWRDYFGWASGPRAGALVLLTISAALMSLALILSGSRSGALCLVFSLGATVQALLRRQTGARRRLAAAYLVAIVAAAVLWVGPGAVAKGYERVWESSSDLGGRPGAWHDALSVVRDFPLAGTGINTYGAAMLFYQRFDLRSHYTAAHNDYLHVAAEGGLLVGVPAVAAIITLVRVIRRRFQEERHRAGGETYWIRVGAVTGLMAIALQEVVDFSLQIPGNAVLFATLCAIAIHRSPARHSTRRSGAMPRVSAELIH